MDCDGPPSPGNPAGASEALTPGARDVCLAHSQLFQHDIYSDECQLCQLEEGVGHNQVEEYSWYSSSSSYPGTYRYGVPDPWTNTGTGGSWHTPGAVSQVDDDPVTYAPVVEPAAREPAGGGGGGGGGQEEEAQESEAATFRLILVEDLLTGTGTGTGGGSSSASSSHGTVSDQAAMDAAIWGELPHELEARVLLFLPTRSQARFRCVCKRWDELVTGARFRAHAAALAFGRGGRHPLCILHIPGLRTLLLTQLAVAAGRGPRPVVREVTVPGMPVPPGWAAGLTRVFTHSRVPVAGAADWGGWGGAAGYGELRCWLLNLAEETWRELPPLRLPWPHDSRSWTVWIQPVGAPPGPGRHGHGDSDDDDDEFQVLVFHAPSATLSAFSSTSGPAWRTRPVAEAPQGLLPPHMAAWTGLAPLPAAPPGPGRFTLIVDAEGPAVFGYTVHSPPVAPAAEAGSSSPPSSDHDRARVSLYRLDERPGGGGGGGGGRSRWECVASGLPPNQPMATTSAHRQQQLVYSCSVHKAQVVGDLVLLVVGVQQQHCGNSCHILAYHIPRGTCKWLHPPLLSDAYRCFSGQQVSFVTPTICQL